MHCVNKTVQYHSYHYSTDLLIHKESTMKKFCTIVILLVTIADFSFAQWTNGKSADVVIGKPNFNLGYANTVDGKALSGPYDVATDPTTGKVFIADYYLNRVLRFSSANAAVSNSLAEGVLGQPDLTGSVAGTTASTMHGPWSLAFDARGNLYVDDSQNHRILRFNNASAKANGAAADGVFGQPNFTSGDPGIPASASNMYWPQGVAVDKRGNLYVGVYNQSRVMRFDSAATKANGAAANVVFGQTSLTTGAQGTTQTTMMYTAGVAIDTNGTLWVVDNGNNRVLRFDSAWSKSTGAPANGVLSAATFTANYGDLTSPTDVCVEMDGTLWVAVQGGVAKYVNAKAKANGADPDLYITGLTATSPIQTAQGVSVDTAGNLYVAIQTTYRAVRYNKAKSKTAPVYADVVFGKPDFSVIQQNTVSSTGLSHPSDIAVDAATGKVFVADTYNDRVLRYGSVHSLTTGQAAEAVFGKSDFITFPLDLPPIDSTTVRPLSLTVDDNGRLWVVDARNRVLRYDNAATKVTNSPADGVLGQANFTSNVKGTSASQMSINYYSSGLAVFGTTLYVSDCLNNRVLRFDNAASKQKGAAADGVLGQSDFATATKGLTQVNLYMPGGLVLDRAGNLYVADLGNNRVLRFDTAQAKPNGAPASAVFGQASFTVSLNNTGQNTLQAPTDVAIDGQGTLYVSESNPNRITIFKNAATLSNGANANNVLGQLNFTDYRAAGTSSGMNAPFGLCVVNTPVGRLLVADTYNNRVLRFSTTVPLTGVNTESSAKIPTAFSLEQNYPNPFNPSTMIDYQLPATNYVTLKVFDLLGREVATLVDGMQEAGIHTATFDMRSANRTASSGVFFYSLHAGNTVQTRRMLLLK